MRESVETIRGLPDVEPGRLAVAESSLGECLTALEHFEDAEAPHVPSYETLRDTRGETFLETQFALARIVELYEAWERPDQAAEWRAKLPDADDSDGK